MAKRDAVVKDPNAPTQLSSPFVHASVTDPAARRVADAMTRNRHPLSRQAIPKYTAPRAGGPTPPIPNLEAPAGDGMTMADQAVVQRAAGQMTGGQVAPTQGGIFTQSPAMQAAASFAPPQTKSRPPQLYPSDLLPAEAQQDPMFRQGQGSMVAVSQPELAFKYGVIRGTGANRRHVPPQELNQATKGLRAESLQDLERLGALSRGQSATTEAEDRAAEQASVQSSAGAAGRFGNSPKDGPQTSDKARVAEVMKKMGVEDDLDFATLRDMMMKDIINNDEQRAIIEERCAKMEVDDLIMHGYVRQKVPILPGKFEPTFQSIASSDDLAIKKLIMLESKGLEINERYLLDKFSVMTVALGLYAINDNKVPGHLDANGKFDEEAFWKKYEFLARNSFHMIGTLGVNFFWFDVRVRKLFVAERLGNG